LTGFSAPTQEPTDAVLVDSMLFTAIDAALASGTPTATLFHGAYTIFRGGPLVEMFAPARVPQVMGESGHTPRYRPSSARVGRSETGESPGHTFDRCSNR
jgi:hypothetical protein